MIASLGNNIDLLTMICLALVVFLISPWGMERYHFCFASDFLEPLPQHVFQDKGLDQAAAGFFFNLLRIQSLGRLPILLTGASIVTQTYEMWARFQLGIREGDPELMRGHPSFNPSRYAEKESLRKEMQMAWFEAVKACKVPSGMTVGEVALSVMVPAGGAELEEGFDATLNAMVTEMWTAFEVLAESVWNATDTARLSLKQALQGKKKIGLRSTFGIRNRYGFTFSDDSAKIMSILHDTSIEAIALVRNVIVHLGGKKDGEFETRGKQLAELGYFFGEHSSNKIELTGPIVLALIKPIPSLGLALAIAVDEWLLSHS